jgi:signal transduction histidine kinase/ActR/RegA family two-component response regulator
MAGEHVPEFYETVIIRKDESRLDVEISACLITFNNKPAEIVFIRDITERKKAEKEKEQLEEKLRQSQKMEAIGQLAGGIAHDFNNMLGGIMGFANLIKIRLASKENKLIRYVDNILGSASRAADLTAKLLAFARRGKFQMVVVDMNGCIINTIKILEHSIDKRIRIIKRFKARPPTVMGDPTQLQNVILNLAVNARDAMPSGGKLTFSTEIVNIQPDFKPTCNFSINPGTYLLIEVSDTGVGIEKKHMAKLFEPFFTTKKQSEGTGLGLASVYGTMKNHNGYIDVESKVGQGATFKIYMKLIDKPCRKTGPMSDNIQSGTGHILVVDDEIAILEFGEEMLAELGYSSKTCKDVLEALNYYKNYHQKIDLVITDMIMPKLSGFQFYKKMKIINPNVKVVVTSGYSLDGKARELLEEGALGFIQKPFSLKQLSVVLYNALFETDAD